MADGLTLLDALEPFSARWNEAPCICPLVSSFIHSFFLLHLLSHLLFVNAGLKCKVTLTLAFEAVWVSHKQPDMDRVTNPLDDR